MSLFFETEQQSVVFLTFCLLGFAAALLLDGLRRWLRDSLKPLCDVLVFLLLGALFVLALLATRSDAIRLYQWLALTLGAILYLCGARRLVRLGCRQIGRAVQNGKKSSEPFAKMEGNAGNASNDITKRSLEG